MKTLKEVEKLTGIKSDNLRQRIHRGTLKAVKKGRDWFISELNVERLKITKTEQCFCQSYFDDENKLRDCTCGKCK